MASVSKFLLTGAGFSKNFGGMLAAEIWTLIFNDQQVQAVPALRDKLIADQDFESVYHDVITNGDEIEREVVSEAIFNAYKQIDNSLMEFCFVQGSPYPVNIYKVQKLIAAFAGPRDSPGFVFTLNQDLFLERHYYNGPTPVLPGVRQPTEWFSSVSCSRAEVSDFVEIVNAEELEELRATFKKHRELVYLKLHGSCNWHVAGRPDQMIIGRDKASQIGRNYLLAWYLELFKSVLSRPDSRLLVIGYGFGDPHINRAISDSITRCGLWLYILDPTPAKDLMSRIATQPEGKTIISGIRAFYSFALRDLFPPNQEETSLWKTIQDEFFEKRAL